MHDFAQNKVYQNINKRKDNRKQLLESVWIFVIRANVTVNALLDKYILCKESYNAKDKITNKITSKVEHILLSQNTLGTYFRISILEIDFFLMICVS